jgi:hypothetical protein
VIGSDDDMRAYLHQMVEQLVELARNEGFTQGAAYLALAAMSLRAKDDGARPVAEGDACQRVSA